MFGFSNHCTFLRNREHELVGATTLDETKKHNEEIDEKVPEIIGLHSRGLPYTDGYQLNSDHWLREAAMWQLRTNQNARMLTSDELRRARTFEKDDIQLKMPRNTAPEESAAGAVLPRLQLEKRERERLFDEHCGTSGVSSCFECRFRVGDLSELGDTAIFSGNSYRSEFLEFVIQSPVVGDRDC